MTSEVVTPTPTTRRGLRFAVVVVALVVALATTCVASITSGQYQLAPADLLGVLLRGIGIDTAWAPTGTTDYGVIYNLRLPRLVLGLLVGAALAVSGVLMQAIFGNPLADAGVVGVSSGAALGAAASITLGLATFGMWTTPAFAFIGGLIAVLSVYFISRSNGRTEVVTLLLTGIAINAIAGAGMAFLTFIGTTSTREQIVFWQLGSLNGAL